MLRYLCWGRDSSGLARALAAFARHAFAWLLATNLLAACGPQDGAPENGKTPVSVRTAKQSWQYLVIINETLGSRWMTPTWFRIGASSLLNDVLMQIRMQREGRYQRPDDFTID